MVKKIILWERLSKRPNGNLFFFFFCLEKKGKKIGRFHDAKNLSTWPEEDEGGFCFGINIQQRNENHHNLKNIWQIQIDFVRNNGGFFFQPTAKLSYTDMV